MTDFYSVLKDSIIRRNLLSPSARHDVYGQAREAMIRRLWSLDPPLSEDEIDTRIGLFDAAVERIENDLESFAADNAAQPSERKRPATPPSPKRRFPVQRSNEGNAGHSDDPYNVRRPPPRQRDEIPYSPAVEREQNQRSYTNGRQLVASQPVPSGSRAAPLANGASASQRRRADDDDSVTPAGTSASKFRAGSYPGERPRTKARQQRVEPIATYEDDVVEEYVEQRAETNGNRRRKQAVVEPPPSETYDAGPYYVEGYRQNGTANEADEQRPYEDAAYYEYDETDRDADPDDTYTSARLYDQDYDTRRGPEDSPIDDVYERAYERPVPTPRTGRRRADRDSRGERERRTHQEARGRIPILAVALAAIAVILFAINAYIFIPILMGSDPENPPVPATVDKADDRLPGLVTPGGASTATIPSTNATAIEIPERNLNIAESIEIFNGSDPTVFEGSSNNPIQFESDSEGGFARISSGVTTAGARAQIGPGIAERMAGQTVRITLLARSSQENGAANMRFALQSGLAVSHWQNAELSSSYGTYGMMWRVPAARTASGDYLLIEPGIPGDGTSTDIRMIKIEIVNS